MLKNSQRGEGGKVRDSERKLDHVGTVE